MDSITEFLLMGWGFENNSTKTLALLLGLASFSGGIVLMFRHQRSLRETQETETDQRVLLFEHRKFRRRTTASSMLAAMGVFLATLYWITEPRAFAIVISLTLILLLGIMGLAVLDLMSVGIQAIGKGDSEEARKKLVDDYNRQRKKLDEQNSDDN